MYTSNYFAKESISISLIPGALQQFHQKHVLFNVFLGSYLRTQRLRRETHFSKHPLKLCLRTPVENATLFATVVSPCKKVEFRSVLRFTYRLVTHEISEITGSVTYEIPSISSDTHDLSGLFPRLEPSSPSYGPSQMGGLLKEITDT